jgi:hypothetical protein
LSSFSILFIKIFINMKKILSIVAIVLLTVSVMFTACRNDAGSQSKTEEATEAPATEEPTAPAEETPEATSEVADTTQQQAE